MEHTTIAYTIAGLALALTFGGMTFFSAVLAPLVFTRLPPDTAGRFIRELFPWYYLSMGVAVLVALAALFAGAGAAAGWEPVVAGLVLAGFVFARQVLMPRINRARDAELAGDAGAARRFQRLHRWSVVLNGVQWLAVLALLLRVLA